MLLVSFISSSHESVKPFFFLEKLLCIKEPWLTYSQKQYQPINVRWKPKWFLLLKMITITKQRRCYPNRSLRIQSPSRLHHPHHLWGGHLTPGPLGTCPLSWRTVFGTRPAAGGRRQIYNRHYKSSRRGILKVKRNRDSQISFIHTWRIPSTYWTCERLQIWSRTVIDLCWPNIPVFPLCVLHPYASIYSQYGLLFCFVTFMCSHRQPECLSVFERRRERESRFEGNAQNREVDTHRQKSSGSLPLTQTLDKGVRWQLYLSRHVKLSMTQETRLQLEALGT